MTPVFIAIVAVAVVSVGCASSPDDIQQAIEVRGERVPVSQLRGVVVALCEAKVVAARDGEAARTIFFDRAHDPLHDIAAAAGEVDRPSAARLLEAKQAVEVGLGGMAGPKLATDLGRLVDATRTALKELSVSTSGCDD